MPVTFDGATRVATEIDTGAAINEIDAVDIYFAWKEWAQDNLEVFPMLEPIGGQSLGSTNLGLTFIALNGWRFRPADYAHKVVLVGNINTQGTDGWDTVPTASGVGVQVVQRVSNLVDSSVARLDLDQLLQAVYIDPSSSFSGTEEGIGTPTRPVNNIADATLIATAKSLRSFVVRGSIQLQQDYTEWSFVGQGAEFAAEVDLNGRDVDSSSFEGLTMTGAMSGRVQAIRCRLDVIAGLDGIFRRCGIDSDFSLDAGADVTLEECFSTIAGLSRPVCTILGAGVSAGLRAYSGGIEFRGLDATSVLSIGGMPASLYLGDASNTGGMVVVRGETILGDTPSPAITLMDQRAIATVQVQGGGGGGPALTGSSVRP